MFDSAGSLQYSVPNLGDAFAMVAACIIFPRKCLINHRMPNAYRNDLLRCSTSHVYERESGSNQLNEKSQELAKINISEPRDIARE